MQCFWERICYRSQPLQPAQLDRKIEGQIRPLGPRSPKWVQLNRPNAPEGAREVNEDMFKAGVKIAGVIPNRKQAESCTHDSGGEAFRGRGLKYKYSIIAKVTLKVIITKI